MTPKEKNMISGAQHLSNKVERELVGVQAPGAGSLHKTGSSNHTLTLRSCSEKYLEMPASDLDLENKKILLIALLVLVPLMKYVKVFYIFCFCLRDGGYLIFKSTGPTRFILLSSV